MQLRQTHAQDCVGLDCFFGQAHAIETLLLHCWVAFTSEQQRVHEPKLCV